MKYSLAAAVLGVIGILAIMQWTAYSVRRHVGIASLSVFPAALDSQRAGTAFERMNRDYSDAFVMQDKSSLASAEQEAATVIASLDSAGKFMAFNSVRYGQILSLLQRVTSLQARSKIDYAAGAENDGTPPSQQDLADLSQENKAVETALETLENDLASDFKTELALIDTLLTVEGILQALVFVGVIAALFFGIRSLIKVTVQRREDEILHEAHSMQESERNMLRALIDNIPDFIYVKDAEGRFVVANPQVARVMGAETPEQLLGKTDFDFYPREIASGFHKDEQNVIRSGKPLYNYEEKCVDGAGNEIHILTTKVPLRNSEGRVIGIAGVGRDISARKKMEDALREAEQKYRGLIDKAIVGIFQSSPEGRFLSVNRSMAFTFGYDSPEDMIAGITDIGRQFYVDPKREQEFKLLMGKLGGVKNFECEVLRKDGSKLWLAMSVRTIYQDGVLVRYEGMCEDISARKKMEDALREAEQKYRGIFDSAIVGIFQSTPDGCLMHVNPSMAFSFGYDSPEEMVASVTDISRQLFVNAKRGVEFMLVMDKIGGVRNFECEVYCKDGRKIWLSMNIRAIRENGAVVRYEGMCEDITARKKMEDALREAEQKYRGIFDNAIIGIYQTTPEGRLLGLNAAITTIFGYDSPDEALQCISDIARQIYVDPKRREDFKLALEKRGVVQNFEGEVFRKDGSRIWLSIGARAVEENGVVVRYEGMCEDISARKKMEDALREAEQKYRGIFDNAIFGIFQTTPDGRLLSANPAMAFTYGYDSVEEGMASASSGDISGRVYVDPERRREFKRLMEENGAVQNFEHEAYRRDGSKIWLSMSARAICENGRVVRYEGMSEDITERKALREQLLQVQKLESVGQLAAGIAHEINTPTQYIGDNVRFLKDAFQELKSLLTSYDRLLPAAVKNGLLRETLEEAAAVVDKTDAGYLLEEIPKAIDQTLEGVSRVAALVSAMKEFSHPDTKEKSPLDLNRAIAGTITVARNEWKYVAEMETDFDPSLPLVSCHPGEFNQVILNLIVNAAHAIADVAREGGPQKGSIKVQTRSCPEWAEVRIRDSGTGIPEELRTRIFDPFFTTKEIGKGTGQGLAIARSVIVGKHGGSLDFETEAGKGTTFIIRLPYDGKALLTKAVAA
jgi:PAS domain S-box-containing protein